MNSFFTLPMLLLAAGPVRFERHDIDSFPAGYQVAVADVNADGRPDVIALSTTADRVDWYENPGWRRRPVARTPKNIDLAVRDLDGDRRPEIALAGGFYFSESTRGGEIQLLRQTENLDIAWQRFPIAVDPVVHRLRWGDLDGDGRPELVHAPLFGPGSSGPRDPKPAHLWAFRPPQKPNERVNNSFGIPEGDSPIFAARKSGQFLSCWEGDSPIFAARKSGQSPWETWKIDETLTVLHGLHVEDLDGDGRDEILTASFEGILRFDFEGKGPAARWQKVRIAAGAKPVSQKPGASRGSSEIAPGKLRKGRPLLAAIEPWHGHQVVVYTPGPGDGAWGRRVLDDTLSEGHALVVADLDGDGTDEIVAGWRAGGGGLSLYDPADAAGRRFTKIPLDRGIAAEGAVAADINLDGRLDLVVIAGRSNNLAWYENCTR